MSAVERLLAEWEASANGSDGRAVRQLRAAIEADREAPSEEWAQHLQDTYDRGKADALEGYEERWAVQYFEAWTGCRDETDARELVARHGCGKAVRILVPASPEPDETP